MLDSIKKMWRIPELRKKILYTFSMLVLYRLVGVIPAPGVDAARVMESAGTNLPLLDLVNMMTGNAFSNMTIMAMGITPYINASIIMQLLCVAIPALERMQKEEDGQKKIARITRYVTVGLALVQAIGLVNGLGYIKSSPARWYNMILVGVSMAGGTALAMWIGERITEKGVGNGISLLIMAGIVSNLFNGITSGFSSASTTSAFLKVLVMIILLVAMSIVITYVDLAERRIPLQIAKQVKGRRVYGGQSTHMSLKVLSVGVMSLIFAYSFLSFPGTIIQLVGGTTSSAYIWWSTYMNGGSVWYMLICALLIIAFTYFYSSIAFDPKQQAENLIMQGAVIPGTRGKNIRSYLQTITNRLNLFQALFLAVLATIPNVLIYRFGINVPFAASSILIAVSVCLETIRTIQGEMSIRGIDMDMENVGFM